MIGFFAFIIIANKQKEKQIAARKRQAFTQVNQTLKQIFDNNTLILDTETTGLGDNDQVIELCILDIHGNSLFDSYIKPKRKMRADNRAMAVHGISNEMLQDAPTWDKVHQQISEILNGKMIVTYNAEFDLRLLEQTAAKYDLAIPDCTFECAMHVYTAYQMVEKNESPRRYKLVDACQYFNIRPAGQVHKAYTDCMMTLELLKAIEKRTQ
ncbi:exonuclease domain-containing protein [Acinetobacter sp. c3-l95]